MRAVAPVVLLIGLGSGCGGPEVEFGTVEGFSYGWDLFNHRVSHLEWGVVPGEEPGSAEAAIGIVGGTSTTGFSEPVGEECGDGCEEFPFRDDSLVKLDYAAIHTRKATVGTAEITLEVGADGGEGRLLVPLGSRGKGEAVAVITKLVVDTDHALADGSEGCYDPEKGWHPRRIAVALGDAALDGTGEFVEVDVSAAFAAGNSLEDERQCVDAVNHLAVASVTVGVTAIAGEVDASVQEVAHGLAYTYGNGPTNPDPQPDPDLADRPLDLRAEDRVFGWSALDWSFHVDDPAERGAYLRTLSFDADVETASASGHATNYSPITQLSGFDYEFSGTVRAIGVKGDIARRTVEETLPTEIGDDGEPVVSTFSLATAP